MAKTIFVYTKHDCPSCAKVKAFLIEAGEEFVATNLTLGQRNKFHKDNGTSTMPQVVVDGERIGGYEETVAHFTEARGLLERSLLYKPFRYPDLVDLAVLHERIHWIEDEISLGQDLEQWKSGKITDQEKSFITNILRLFTQSDVAVATNYGDLFIPKFKNNEARNWLYSVAARETTHQRAYALLNDTLGLPDAEYAKFLSIQEMADKAEFMMDNEVKSHKGLATALAKSMISEGLFLFASFAMLMSFPRCGKMQSGMGTVVEWSVRDEDLHCQGLEILFREFCKEHPSIINDEFKTTIYSMFREAVVLEDTFIDYVFADYDLESITAAELKQYIRFIADQRLVQLGMKPNWGIEKNPLPWMEEMLAGSTHTNFFEARATDYSRGGMSGAFNYSFLLD